MVAVKNLVNTVLRFLNKLRRPSKRTNTRLLLRRGESVDSFIIREATIDDIRALASLHVKTWSDTYPGTRKPPAFETREWQWRKSFLEENDGSWFCYVIENNQRQLIGFSKGKIESPGHSGNVDKIYLLREYQRLGLGRKLLCHVARRFLSRGVHSMTLFGIPQNPSCAFHEAMGGERLWADNGEFHGGYIWKDIQQLAAGCPP